MDSLQCMEAHWGDCVGDVEYRMNLTGTGLRTIRCDKHWADRLKLEDEINRRYPPTPPADFDYLDAGEYWDEY